MRPAVKNIKGIKGKGLEIQLVSDKALVQHESGSRTFLRGRRGKKRERKKMKLYMESYEVEEQCRQVCLGEAVGCWLCVQ